MKVRNDFSKFYGKNRNFSYKPKGEPKRFSFTTLRTSKPKGLIENKSKAEVSSQALISYHTAD